MACNQGEYLELFYPGHDGLKLYARDYPAPPECDRLPVLCMHGLTRNSADFEPIASQLNQHFRLIIPDQRGRGLSHYDSNPNNYQIPVYAKDMLKLLQLLGINKVLVIGTSMGGLIAMTMAAINPTAIHAIAYNDIGPVIESAGIARIGEYVSCPKIADNWQQAGEHTQSIHRHAYPDFNEDDWLAFAKRTHKDCGNGQLKPAYDTHIVLANTNTDQDFTPPDLWALFDATKNLASLVVRGQLSEILSRETVQTMVQKHPQLQALEAPNVGHAPILNEPSVYPALEQFLLTNGRIS